jgi:hypothetical protein
MTTLPDALTAVESALEGLSVAMSTGQPDAVLSAEEPLAEAVRHLLAAPPPGSEDDRDRAIAAIRAVRLALLKCQLLGRASAGLQHVVAPQSAYTTNGYGAPARGPVTLEARS